HPMHWLQEMHQQGAGRVFFGWLSVGRHRHGRYRGSGEGSGSDGDLENGRRSSALDAPFGARFVFASEIQKRTAKNAKNSRRARTKIFTTKDTKGTKEVHLVSRSAESVCRVGALADGFFCEQGLLT